jgi:aspartate/methionine/tyrosine aminotransferase
MSPTMPTGLVMDDAHWDALATLDHRPWVLHDAAMDRLHFGEPPPPPAANDRLADRVITVGSASKELRLIGWRVGWVVGPEGVISDVALVGLTNVVCQVGIAQQAVAAALTAPGCEDDVAAAVDTLRQRAELVLAELEGYPVIPPGGGWSMLLDTRPLGLSPSTLSERLLTRGKVAATPMDGWGPSGQHYLRIVYANETVQRLSGLRQRFTAAIG